MNNGGWVVGLVAATLFAAWALYTWLDRTQRCATPAHAQLDGSVPYEVTPTDEDVANAVALVAVKKVKGKGLGVVARKDIPAHTLLGPYPGKRYTSEEHQRRKRAGVATDEYATDFWTAPVGEDISEDFVLDPMDRDVLQPEYEFVTPYVNEPGVGQAPNMVWVWNFPRYRLEMWTSRPVRKGEELTICYGAAYRRRGYRTGCSKPGVEPVRHAVARHAQSRPTQYVDAVKVVAP